jgi:glutathione synthase/RimK-type ligase-like ATP-grasp enzyme
VNIAGVDVAIAVDGPRMIELNVRPDQIGCARLNLPLKQVDQWMRTAEAQG